MKETPLMFSGSQVRAIREDRMTQTRRIVTPRPLADPDGRNWEWHAGKSLVRAGYSAGYVHSDKKSVARAIVACCPHGRAGDRIWAKETYGYMNLPGYTPVHAYKADPEGAEGWGFPPGFKWRSSLFMPRAASRITLEINGIRAENLQDIREADALAEGVEHSTLNDPRVEFRWMWESIYGPGSWDANPWVWVIKFKRVEA